MDIIIFFCCSVPNRVLVEARHIYSKSGFKLVKQKAHHSFGKELTGETLELYLS